MYIRCDNFYVTGGIIVLIYDLMLILGGYFIGEYLMGEKSPVYNFLNSRTASKVFFENEKSIRTWLRIISFATVLIPLLITFLLYLGSGKFRILYEALTVVIFYLAGIFQAQKDYRRILTNAKIVIGSATLFILLLVSSFFSWASYLKPVLYGFTYIFIALCMVLKNISNLDINIYLKKGAENSPVSKKVKKKNIIYTSIIFFIVAILFNIKQVYQVVYNCIRLIVISINNAIMAFLSFLGSLLASSETQKLPENEVSNVLTRKGGKPSLVVTAITIVLMIAFFHFMYKLIKTHWDTIKTNVQSFFATLAEKIKKLIKQEGCNSYKTRKMSVLEYDDEVEKIGRNPNISVFSKKDKQTSKRRSLIKYKDPVKRIREGYAYLVERLAAKKIHIKKCNTPSEIYHETKQINGFSEQFETITQLYEKVRYQDIIPSEEDINLFDDKSSKAVHIIKKLP